MTPFEVFKRHEGLLLAHVDEAPDGGLVLTWQTRSGWSERFVLVAAGDYGLSASELRPAGRVLTQVAWSRWLGRVS